MRERYDIVARPQQAQALGYAQPPLQSALPSEDPEPSLIKPILRRWWIVALCILAGLGAARAYIEYSTPLYTSFAKLYIAPTSGVVIDTFGNSERDNYLATQAEVIRSTRILNRVAEVPNIRGMKTFATARGNPVLYLREELEADPERKTDLIYVGLASPYPEESYQIVKAVVDSYMAYSAEEKDDKKHQLLAVLQDNKKIADQELAKATKDRRDFLVSNPDITGAASGTTVVNDGHRQIGSEMTQAQLDLINARATYGDGHRIVQSLERKARDLATLYEEQIYKLRRQQDKGAQLQALNHRVETSTGMAQRLGEQIQKVELDLSGQTLMDVDVIEPPRVAEFPSSPKKNRLMAVGLVLGALLGAGLALLRDRMDGRMRSVEEIQATIGLPILGVVPAMSGRRTAVARAMTVHLDPRSVVAEAYRTIRTAVYFGSTGNPSKTLLMTSPEPGDGKTTCASNLAIAIAQTGRSVLLLDADFRKPTQHKNLDIKDTVGLSSVLAGLEPMERAIQRTGVEGLDILPCGPIPANPSEILNSREFGELIDALARQYDHIIFDSPPVNVVTDARILAAVCDASILVLRADKSTRKSGEHARNALMAVGANILGTIVNDAPHRKGYDVYGGSYYYGSPDRSASAGAVPPARRLTSVGPTPGPDDDEERTPGSRRRNIA